MTGVQTCALPIYRAVTDYISGMSDEFAIRAFEEYYVPRRWHVL